MLSTHMNNKYFRSKFMGSEEIYTNAGEKIEVLNFVNFKLAKVINKLNNSKIIKYKGEPITTVSYREYGNTSLWWIIVMVNGAIFPDDLISGQDLVIPDLKELNQLLNSTSKNRAGQKVTV